MKSTRLRLLAAALLLAFSVPAYSQSVIGGSVIGQLINFASATIKGTLKAVNGGTGSSTVPSAGQLLVGNAGGTAYAPVTASGDLTVASTGAHTLATVNSNTGSFGSSTAIPNFTVNGKGLITAAGTNAVVAPAGTLSGATLASGVTASSLTSLGAQTQALNMNSNLINNVTDPVSAQDAATKNYVDSALTDTDIKAATRAAAQGNLAFTRSGNTYTASGVGVLLKATIDSGWSTGAALSVGDRLLLPNQTSNVDNGIVTITNIGAIGTNAVLTRSTDMNASAQVTSEMEVPVAEGTDATISYKLSSSGPFTLNTTALPFTKAGGPPTGAAGGNLTGTYPNPMIGAAQVTNAMLAGSIDLTSKVTGALPIVNGGCNATTAQGCAANLSVPYNIGVSGVKSNHTGDANLTTLATIAVPAGGMGANGCVEIKFTGSATGTNSKSWFVTFGGTQVTQISATTQLSLKNAALFACNQNNASIQTWPASGQVNDSTNTGAVVPTAIDTTQAQNILIKGQLTNTGENIAVESYIVNMYYKP